MNVPPRAPDLSVIPASGPEFTPIGEAEKPRIRPGGADVFVEPPTVAGSKRV